MRIYNKIFIDILLHLEHASNVVNSSASSDFGRGPDAVSLAQVNIIQRMHQILWTLWKILVHMQIIFCNIFDVSRYSSCGSVKLERKHIGLESRIGGCDCKDLMSDKAKK